MKANLVIKNTYKYKAIPTDEAFRSAETSADSLNNSEVQSRVQIIGFNEVAEKEQTRFSRDLARYSSRHIINSNQVTNIWCSLGTGVRR